MPNIIRQNEVITEMAEAGILTRGQVEAAFKSPVFLFDAWDREWHEGEHEYLSQIGVLAMHDNFPIRGPFPCWRLVDKNGDFIQVYNDTRQKLWNVYRCRRQENVTLWSRHQSKPDYQRNVGGTGCEAWVNGRNQGYVGDDIGTPDGDFPALPTWDILADFVAAVMLPGTAILRIEPQLKPGKTAKWQLARTHYVLITHRQAQVMQRKKRGPTDREVVLAAHWRRAHFRRLSSPAFTHKRGLVVPVRHAWVGPKQWIGTDAKIYKVIDLPVPSTPAVKTE